MAAEPWPAQICPASKRLPTPVTVSAPEELALLARLMRPVLAVAPALTLNSPVPEPPIVSVPADISQREPVPLTVTVPTLVAPFPSVAAPVMIALPPAAMETVARPLLPMVVALLPVHWEPAPEIVSVPLPDRSVVLL